MNAAQMSASRPLGSPDDLPESSVNASAASARTRQLSCWSSVMRQSIA